MKSLSRYLLAALLGLALPAAVYAQDPEGQETQPDTQPAQFAQEPQDAIRTLCTVSENLYKIPAAQISTVRNMEKYRNRQERLTIQIEQQKKLGQNPEINPADNGGAELFLKEPTVCKTLDESLKAYIAAHEQEVTAAVKQLLAQTATMTDEDKAAAAKRFAACLNPNAKPFIRDAQQVLYVCVYRQKNIRNVMLNYSVEKTMRQFQQLQAPLVSAWLGNMD